MEEYYNELAAKIKSLTLEELHAFEQKHGIIVTFVAESTDTSGGNPNPGGPGHGN